MEDQQYKDSSGSLPWEEEEKIIKSESTKMERVTFPLPLLQVIVRVAGEFFVILEQEKQNKNVRKKRVKKKRCNKKERGRGRDMKRHKGRTD